MNYNPVYNTQEEEVEWCMPSQATEVLVYAFDPVLVTLCTLVIGALLAFVLLRFTANLHYPDSQATIHANKLLEPQGSKAVLLDSIPNQVSCKVSDGFPPAVLQWCGVISQYAERHGLQPDLVAALILQESGGDPNAYSHSGAVGLMQVMPRDGLAASFMCANGPCFSDRPTMDELRDPEFNIAYGTRMLANLLKRSGDLREALRSYGPRDMGYGYADIILRLFQRYSKSAP